MHYIENSLIVELACRIVLQRINNLSRMHAAISTVVTVAEILKNNGFAVEKSEASPTSFSSLLYSFLPSNFEGTLAAEIKTLTIDMRDEPGARPIPKAKVKIQKHNDYP